MTRAFANSYERLGAETEVVGFPVLPLIKQMHDMCPAEAAGYIHWGATTQDIMDTATVLQMKDGLIMIGEELEEMERILVKLAKRYKNT